MSLGGALGGIVINLVAPYVFTTFFEFPLMLVASVALAAVLLVLAFRQLQRDGAAAVAGIVGVAAVLGVAYWQIGEDYWKAADPNNEVLFRARNFYGVVSSAHLDKDEHDGGVYIFRSGHIVHGRQYANPAKQADTNIAYWGPGSGCRRALEYKTQKPDCRIGVVGLGIGTIAGFAKEGQYVRMYEINPEVTKIALNPPFRFLSDCKAKVDLVAGDARLQLERELAKSGSHQFDVLCLDAFSGDAVPTHLLTTEAFETYKQHMKPDGIIVVNITNVYLDLYPAVVQLAKAHSYQHTRVFKKRRSEILCFRNYFVLLTNDEKFLAQTPEDMEEAKEGGKEFLVHREAPLWTDRYHSLWHVLQ